MCLPSAHFAVRKVRVSLDLVVGRVVGTFGNHERCTESLGLKPAMPTCCFNALATATSWFSLRVSIAVSEERIQFNTRPSSSNHGHYHKSIPLLLRMASLTSRFCARLPTFSPFCNRSVAAPFFNLELDPFIPKNTPSSRHQDG